MEILGNPELLGENWAQAHWVRNARRLLAERPNTWRVSLPADHAARVERMMLPLDGLSIGDALGEAFAYRPEYVVERLRQNDLPGGPWFHTDDTEMAISIAAVLRSHGKVDQDALAKRFARRWERDPERGYGKMTRVQMRQITMGEPWQVASCRAFGGQGSMGNGGAMRVAPLGAYFAEEPERAVRDAKLSCVVTHTHPEGIAGTVATAVAATMAWQLRDSKGTDRPLRFFKEVLRLTPESEVKYKIQVAAHMPAETEAAAAARSLGKGDLVTAPDTVPFCLWVAAHHLDNYVEALSHTIRVGVDCDTNAAIVGGIVALSAGRQSIPADWLDAREAIRF